MPVTALPCADVEVYFAVRIMPEECRPGRVVRQGHRTFVVYDPRMIRAVGMAWMVDNLTPAELDAIWPSYQGGAERGDPTVDTSWIANGEPVLLYVPPHLRLDGAPALQGGSELTRRMVAGQLAEELQMLADELREDLGVPEDTGAA